MLLVAAAFVSVVVRSSKDPWIVSCCWNVWFSAPVWCSLIWLFPMSIIVHAVPAGLDRTPLNSTVSVPSIGCSASMVSNVSCVPSVP